MLRGNIEIVGTLYGAQSKFENDKGLIKFLEKRTISCAVIL